MDETQSSPIQLMTSDLKSVECDRKKLSKKSPYFKTLIEKVGSTKEIVILLPSGKLKDLQYLVDFINFGNLKFNKGYNIHMLLFLGRKYQIEGLDDCVMQRRKYFYRAELKVSRTNALEVINDNLNDDNKITAVQVLTKVFNEKISYSGKQLGNKYFECLVDCMGFEFYDVGYKNLETLKEEISRVVLKKLLDIEMPEIEILSDSEKTDDESDYEETEDETLGNLIELLGELIVQYLEELMKKNSINNIFPNDLVRVCCKFIKQKYETMMTQNKKKFICSLPFLNEIYQGIGRSIREAEQAACCLALKSIDIHIECVPVVRINKKKRIQTLFLSFIHPFDQRWKLYVSQINPPDEKQSFAMTLTERIDFLLKNMTEIPSQSNGKARFIRTTSTPVLTNHEWLLLEMIDANLYPEAREGDIFTLSVTINNEIIYGRGTTLIKAKDATIEKAFEFLENLEKSLSKDKRDEHETVKTPKGRKKPSCLKPQIPVRTPLF